MSHLLLAITFIFGLCVVDTAAKAQQSTPYESISTAEGLSQGMVFDILQDKEGFIWVATKNGLNRYDGYSFKVFTNDPYNVQTLSSNTIVKLFEDSKGRIWAGTEDAGVNVYDKKSGKFYRLLNTVSDASTISGNAIRLINELPDGRVLVAAAGAGFNLIKLPALPFDKDQAPAITRLALPNNADVYGMGKIKAERFGLAEWTAAFIVSTRLKTPLINWQERNF